MKRYVIIFFLYVFSVAYSQNKKPNIVIIISDDHAYQAISAYNKNHRYIDTPNIDRLAEGGMIFHKSYVNNSICGPSRASLLTGKMSHKNGYKDNENSSYNSNQQQFVNLLQENGYQTAWIGKYHLGYDPKGFDFYKILIGQGYYYNPDFIEKGKGKIREEGYVANLVEDAAEKWLDERDAEKPFCLVIGHKNTHRTWMPDLQDIGAFDKAKFSIPETFYDDYRSRKAAALQEMSIAKDMRMGYDLKMLGDDFRVDNNFKRMNEEQLKAFENYYKPIQKKLEKSKLKGEKLAEWKYKRYMNDYLSTAVSLDRNIGRTLDYLEKNGLAENTIVIYTSDQGFYLGEHGWFDKRWMYEESYRTPLLIKYPKIVPAKSSSNSFVMNIDIAPTLLELADVKIPRDIQGVSMLPILKNPNAETQNELYYHYYENGEHAVSPHFGVNNKRYKLIRYYKRVENWELFDLEKDPQEMDNIFDAPKYQEVKKEMMKLLKKEIQEYEDFDALNVLFEDQEFKKYSK
ncbi:Arylsulfatase [Candidatus Ornithobacterium hominis]|uniref:Arylsulfatase n=1 Tax=Candidatus Ornithobacterium hominis TaxID=2497989 RepID=A0A383U381_9FLAO|nr:sulfatase [Candidatus Ornithobacterium hominis]MCT7904658.1 sulfatase [Candidatus Ornithobacterium hominis]SZD74000.1 Arylsulfatase [Candidatus Ornithobacterium hominis]